MKRWRDDYEPTPVDREWAELVARLLAGPGLGDLIRDVQQRVQDRDLGAAEKEPHVRALIRLVMVQDRAVAHVDSPQAEPDALAEH